LRRAAAVWLLNARAWDIAGNAMRSFPNSQVGSKLVEEVSRFWRTINGNERP
jgi:hypothetical protein